MAAVHSGTSSTPLIDEFLRALNAEFASKAVISTLAIASDPSHAERFGSHDKIVGLVKSLQATEYVLGEQAEKTTWFLTGEGQLYAKQGTPEFRLVTWMRDQVAQEGGVEVAALRSGFGSEADVAVSNAMKMRWLEIDKATKKVSVKQIPDRDIVQGVLRVVEGLQLAAGGATESEETELFKQLSETAPETPPEKILQELKKRKLVESKKLKYLNLQKGPRFSMQMTKPVADLTADLLVGDAWQKADFKEYNFFASGRKIRLGSIHPLIQVMRQFKLILRSMGFEEMSTNQYADSSFWCFDTLFMPQQHPARDAQDTFFLLDPAHSDTKKIPRDYLNRVKDMHEHGGCGSTGWQYNWSVEESTANVMRTHTTATSARLLYSLAQEIQMVEGLVADRGLTIGHLIGIMKTFYKQIGIEKLRFKPAYNPYTEPSMEIFGYHSGLKKWIEVGNSGMFRPEMLLPMGLPEDVSVIAWGLSLERPTMIRYGISNIRQLFGHRAMLGMG